MRVVRIDIEQTGGEMVEPAGNARAQWTARRGLQVRIVDDRGHIGWGEASPLPGYAPDNLQDARGALAELTRAELPPIDGRRAPLDAIGAWLGAWGELVPSARFAVETAVLDAWGHRAGEPVHALVGASSQRMLPLAKAIDTGPARWRDAVRDAWEQGYGTVKLKIGRDPTREMDALRALRAEWGAKVSLRLDANGTLGGDARDWLARLAQEVAPAWVEEPVRAFRWEELLPAPLPLALDESLHASQVRDALASWIETGRCRVVVLKPMALGGWIRCVDLARRARHAGADVVVSHCLGGPVELAACAELARALDPDLAAGLAPHAGLDAWPRVPVPGVRPPVLEPHDGTGLGWPAEAPNA